MRLIIDTLIEYEHLKYHCTGALTVTDPNLISLDFTVRKDALRGDFNVRGLIDMPLALQAQYDSSSLLNDHPDILAEIDQDLQAVSEKINRLI